MSLKRGVDTLFGATGRIIGWLVADIMIAIFGIVATSLVVAYGGSVEDNPYVGAEIAFLVIFSIAFVAIVFQAMRMSYLNRLIGTGGGVVSGTTSALENLANDVVRTTAALPSAALGTVTGARY